MMSMLEAQNQYMKFSQHWGYFVCVFVIVVELC